MSILITFATEKEAFGTIQRLNATKINDELFSFSVGQILITGIGNTLVQKTVPRYLNDKKKIINIGVAGALNPTLERYSVHKIGTAFFENNPPIFLNKGAQLLSVTTPLYHSINGYDLVDMEGYSIAFIAQKYSISCSMYKIVSDFCNEDSKTMIQKSLNYSSSVMANCITKEIKNVIKTKILV